MAGGTGRRGRLDGPSVEGQHAVLQRRGHPAPSVDFPMPPGPVTKTTAGPSARQSSAAVGQRVPGRRSHAMGGGVA